MASFLRISLRAPCFNSPNSTNIGCVHEIFFFLRTEMGTRGSQPKIVESPRSSHRPSQGRLPLEETGTWTPPPAPEPSRAWSRLGRRLPPLALAHLSSSLCSLSSPLLHGLSELPFSLRFSWDRLTQGSHP